jgi:uncharacterized repeat protein (TIGR03803 family)
MKTIYLRMANEQLSALLLRLLCAAVLVLPVFGAQAGVVFTSLYSFTGTNDGAYPVAELVQGRDGNLYGTTGGTNVLDGSGTNGWGSVFQITTNGALTTLYSFTGGNDGAYCWAGLVQGSDGFFYGTTHWGGANGYGTVFKISTNGAFTSLHSFAGTYSFDGANPSGLVQGSDGYFYGTTPNGGYYGQGNVFRISINGTVTNLYSFVDNNNGILADPLAGLVQGSDGYLYGTTYGYNPTFGKNPNHTGFVFKISTNGVLAQGFGLISRSKSRLVQGSDGYFYGTTVDNTVFRTNPTGGLTNHLFLPLIDGRGPEAGLVQGSDGNFYGTTSAGGTNGYGTVFKFNTNWVFTTLYSFTGGNDGATPVAELVQGSDGSFYGTTHYGGTNNLGTIFRLTIVPPQLAIVPAEANVILSWPTNATGFTLESTFNLGAAAVWNTNSTAPVVISGQNTVTNPITGSQQFFRLTQ